MDEDSRVEPRIIYIGKSIAGSWGWRPHGDLHMRDGFVRYASARYAARRYYTDKGDRRTLLFKQETYEDC